MIQYFGVNDFSAFNQVLTFDAATAYGLILAVISFSGFCIACHKEKKHLKRINAEAAV